MIDIEPTLREQRNEAVAFVQATIKEHGFDYLDCIPIYCEAMRYAWFYSYAHAEKYLDMVFDSHK